MITSDFTGTYDCNRYNAQMEGGTQAQAGWEAMGAVAISARCPLGQCTRKIHRLQPMTPPQYRAQCRKIRELLASRERPKGRELAGKLLKSFRDYRFHLGDLSTGRITLGTRSMVIGTLLEAGYDLNTINYVTPAERALLDECVRLHNTGKTTS